MSRAYVLALLPLAACTDDGPGAPAGVETPAGYRLNFMDRGSIAAGHDVCLLFDQAVEDAAVYLWKYGTTKDEVEDACRSYRINGVDHFLFGTGASATGYATGMIGQGLIVVALYTRQRNADGPSWTRFDWGDGNVHSGIVPRAYPALAHELGHHFFGASFEHGWAPPIVNGMYRVGPPPDWSDMCPVRP